MYNSLEHTEEITNTQPTVESIFNLPCQCLMCIMRNRSENTYVILDIFSVSKPDIIIICFWFPILASYFMFILFIDHFPISLRRLMFFFYSISPFYVVFYIVHIYCGLYRLY